MPFLSQDEALGFARKLIKHVYQEERPISLKAQTQNWVFQTILPDGEQAIIRVRANPPLADDAYPVTCEESTLRTLARETTLAIPHLISDVNIFRKDGHDYEVILFTYLQGESPSPTTLTPDEAARIGRFLAQLHRETERWIFRSPHHPTLDAEGLLGTNSRYASADEEQFLSELDRALLNVLKQRVADVEILIGPAPEHQILLHGDFLLQNIVLDGESVGVLDFEMCGWGHDLYDLAPLLWQMKTLPQYEAIADAYWHGYSQLRELPPREWLEIFIAARQGASVRWLIQNRHLPAYAPRVPALIRQRMDEIAAFLETGILKRN